MGPHQKRFLLVIFKILARPILFYADVIYGKRLDESIKKKLEMVQYNAALVITGANQIYTGLGFEFLADWRWFQKIFFVLK